VEGVALVRALVLQEVGVGDESEVGDLMSVEEDATEGIGRQRKRTD
jgi:hypothetical protein